MTETREPRPAADPVEDLLARLAHLDDLSVADSPFGVVAKRPGPASLAPRARTPCGVARWRLTCASRIRSS